MNSQSNSKLRTLWNRYGISLTMAAAGIAFTAGVLASFAPNHLVQVISLVVLTVAAVCLIGGVIVESVLASRALDASRRNVEEMEKTADEIRAIIS